ncbi:baseplate J/gp47 family protein [Anaerotignum sp. MB30-C6]|uniref:baseplate J/gp47 family protein n=1 Tax=Anaerotignum sp. MB30-C6 TaxID=3070814 RepID=UPI0027DBB8D8|nr:baseplate J/gp47 family protein [Anaerotignum sp. MB30-C6]WMI80895.1 baseplate J/gp47 family protein [Anaerotignum sp. MB30-C6]
MTVTREGLRSGMLGNVSNNYDKTEGSFFYDAIDPVAIELEKSYAEQEKILKNGFAQTSEGVHLERKCAEIGIKRKLSTKSTGTVQITGTAGASITKGSLVASEAVTFEILEDKTIGVSKVENVAAQCVQGGSIGNVPSNAIKFFPVTLAGVEAVANAEPFSGGYNEEADDSLRQRYFEKVNAPATSGNTFHYKQWAKAVTGVGDAKVFPLWNGNGTVKVVICDSNKRAADSNLVADTAAYIETQRPIGATVTVESATEKPINIIATIVFANGRTLEQAKVDFEKTLTEYFKEIAFDKTYASYAKIGSLLYDTYGIADYSDLKANNGIVNIPLLDTEIPVLGTVVLS